MGKSNDIICWWSGGVTSAVACWIAIQIYGIERCRIIFIDTFNEHPDTYRFKNDCEVWYGKNIETITGIGSEYKNIMQVWFQFLSLNVATGAICSTQLKRLVREKWQTENTFTYQVFGFDDIEMNRAKSLKLNHPKAKGIYPLLMYAYSKKDCMEILKYEFIPIPLMYYLGFQNNNCFGTGCVQGGVGYWQKMYRDFRYKFLRMAVVEHQLSRLAGKPVTMLKDQSKKGKSKGKGENLVFLVYNPEFPEVKTLSEMPECKVEPLVDCNGFCGTNDLTTNKKGSDINFDLEVETHDEGLERTIKLIEKQNA